MRSAFGLIAALALGCSPAVAQTVPAGEEAVDPYEVSNLNAGVTSFTGDSMLKAFHGREGIGRIVDDLAAAVKADRRTGEIFHATDIVRFKRVLREHFCYVLNGGCDYTGREMASVHDDHGITVAEFNAVVELLQDAMEKEGVAFAAQNRFLAKLAPLKRAIVVR